jgi:hypothetical protein
MVCSFYRSHYWRLCVCSGCAGNVPRRQRPWPVPEPVVRPRYCYSCLQVRSWQDISLSMSCPGFISMLHWEQVLLWLHCAAYPMAGVVLVWLLPIAIFIAARWVLRGGQQDVFLGVFMLFGLVLLVYQFRFHYYGSTALYLPLLVTVSRCWPQGRKAHFASVASLMVMLVSVAPGASIVIRTPATGLLEDHVSMRPVYKQLTEVCKQHPGIVLANMHEGHYIRYYTDCSVMVNSFIATPQHVQQVKLSERLFTLTPTELRQQVPYVDYVLVRVFSSDQREGRILRGRLREILLGEDESERDGFELIVDSSIGAVVGRWVFPLARVYAVKDEASR